MFSRFKRDWEKLKAGEPGHRFQDRYYRRHPEGKQINSLKRPFVFGFGLIIIGVGILLLLFPGPGWGTIILGVAFMAGESLFLAKILDLGELIIRKFLGKLRTEN